MADLKTAVFDWQLGDFTADPQGGVVTATQTQAVEQIILKATQTVRGLFLIYGNIDNPELDHKYGNDAHWTLLKTMPEASRISELTRNIYDALVYDPWITDVIDMSIERLQDPETRKWAYYFTGTVVHIYGTSPLEGVSAING